MSAQGESNNRTAAPQPDKGTLLTLDRNFMAAERTLMAWIRTSLSLISFGFTVGKFFDYLAAEKGRPMRGFVVRMLGPDGIGMALVALGTFALLFALIDHRGTIKRLQGEGLEKRRTPTIFVATILCFLGISAILSLAL
jgi:putative membrane protein